MTPPANRETMTGFVRDLFNNVLDVPAPNDNQVAAWVDRAMKLNDPLALFQQFIAQKANKNRLAQRDDTVTHWPNGHFYSPVVSRADAEAEWPRLSRPRNPAEVDICAADQAVMLRTLPQYFPTIPFTEHKDPRFRFYFENPSYGYGDALIYWAMLNHLKPKRIIEVGSGFSSALALDTVDLLGLPTTCTFIDPFPAVAEAATAPLGPSHRILPRRIQDIDLDVIRELQDGDLLFIDSSHIVKTGSDVHFEITEMLPLLAPGVIVHFHDVFYPFEYHKRWITQKNHSWNETYFLHAFLMYNSAFRIVFFNHFVAATMRAELLKLSPVEGKRFLLNPGGGLWLRRA